MISFRFHVVSITAVFLAIAIGVVVGTTYVDGAVVDGLRNRINAVEENLDERRAENDRLEQELGRTEAFTSASASFAVSGRLTDAPVLLLATRGVDEAAVQRMVVLIREAGGATPGVVWLERAWALEGDDQRAAVAEILDRDPDDNPEALRSDAWAAVADELAAPPAGESDTPTGADDPTTTGDEPRPETLAALAEVGLLSIDAVGDDSTGLGDLAGTGPRILLVTGARAEPEPAGAVPLIASSVVDADLLTVLADIHIDAPEAPPRGEELTASMSDALIESVTVVDHADRIEGQVAAVLALSAEPGAVAGHLGYGDGAVGVLPEWTPP